MNHKYLKIQYFILIYLNFKQLKYVKLILIFIFDMALNEN